jgi:ubiquinol-cytochrome c reductase cytochrome b subunit
MTLIFLMPIIGKSERGHRFNVGLLFGILAFAGILTFVAVKADRNNPTYIASKEQAAREAAIVKELAKGGIPPEGALALLQGPKLFAQHCASCHTHGGENGLGNPVEKPSAPDLKGFASREYLTELLHPERFASEKFFGNTAHGTKGKMVKKLKQVFEEFEDDESLKKDFENIILAISAEAKLASQSKVDLEDREAIQKGRELFDEIGCTDCHALGGWNADDYSAPDLTGYGSRNWMLGIVNDPAHERFYGKKNDRMPAFGKDEKLTRRQMERIVDWLRGE